MPIYVYACKRCEREHEELQKFDEPPPVLENCPKGAVIVPAQTDELGTQPEQRESCDLARQMTSAAHRFDGSPSSEGLGGWKTGTGGVMYRQHQGVQGNFYGDSSTGRE